MNINRDLPKVTVTEKCRKRTAYGHPWIYDNEVVSADEITDGELADVVSEKNRYIGTGFYNSKSKIRVRIISRSTNDKFDEDFFRRRLQYAYDYRKTVMSHEDMTACRLIFGEGDSFPGLTVDRFNNLLSVQILSLGIEKRRDIILPALLDILRNDGCKIDGIYLRNDVNIRTLEGMAEEKGWYLRENDVSPVTVITENGKGLIVVAKPNAQLEVGTLQNALDVVLKATEGATIDYIHGADVVNDLGSKHGNIGFLLPPMEKSAFFRTVVFDGALPRKTFSMGEAHEKRYYLECRKICK